MITTALRILLVEDLKSDADLIGLHIQTLVKDPQIKVVDKLTDLKRELVNFVPEVLISDYNLPSCSGLEVLKLAKTIDPELPFIFLTGTVDDAEIAANTVLAGVNGFILKKYMNELDKKLLPLLKSVVFNLPDNEDDRERIRRSKIMKYQVRDYLLSAKAENKEQWKTIKSIRNNQVKDLNKKARDAE